MPKVMSNVQESFGSPATLLPEREPVNVLFQFMYNGVRDILTNHKPPWDLEKFRALPLE